METYIIFSPGWLRCCFKLKANVFPSPSSSRPLPHSCVFQLQSCENKSSFGFCCFTAAIGDVRVNTESIRNAGRMGCSCDAARLEMGLRAERLPVFPGRTTARGLRFDLFKGRCLPPRWRLGCHSLALKKGRGLYSGRNQSLCRNNYV